MKTLSASLLVSLVLARGIVAAADFGSAFTFQGRLGTPSGPAQGPHDLDFTLWDRDVGGNLLGTQTREEWPVSNGVFTVELDYGPNAFASGKPLWLQIQVKHSASTNYPVTLAPRTAVRPAPYSLLAAEVVDGSVTTSKLADGAVTGAKLADNSISAPKLTSNSVANAALADGAVTPAKLANGAVTSAKLDLGAVGPQHIAAGAVGSMQLASNSVHTGKIADGSILGVDIAAGVIGSNHLAAGSVGTTHIAAGAVTSATIAPGAVTASQIADGAVGTDALAKPYQSGVVTFSGQTATFYPTVVTQAFSPPFSGIPVVTVAAEAADAADTSQFSAQVLGRSASGFSARIGHPPRVCPVDRGDLEFLAAIAPTKVSPTPFFTVPAFATVRWTNQYDSFGPAAIEFWRASSADGTSWTKVTVATNNSGDVDTAPINGRPAVAFLRWNGPARGPAYVRAADNVGSAWGSVLAVAPSATNTHQVDLKSVSGRPAMLFDEGPYSGPRRFWYVRASNADGTSWGAPTAVAPPADTLGFSELLMVNGRPSAVFAAHPGNLTFVRAADTNGTTWLAPVNVVPSAGLAGVSVAIVNGRPAIAYVRWDSAGYYFVRALDPDGAAWGTPVAVAQSPVGFQWSQSLRLEVVNDRPALLFSNGGAYYTEALDADGASWRRPIELASHGDGTAYGLLNIGGGVAALFTSLNGLVDYIWSGPPPAGLQWTAVAP